MKWMTLSVLVLAVVSDGHTAVTSRSRNNYLRPSFGKAAEIVRRHRDSHQGSDTSGPRYDVCTTAECTIAAAELIEAMDLSADPCEDFFQYSCGGWLESHDIPEDQSSWGQMSIMDEKLQIDVREILEREELPDDPSPVNAAKDMYTACMDTDKLDVMGVSPLTLLLAEMGGWPLTLDNWDEEGFDWQTVAAMLRRNYVMNYLTSVGVAPDVINTNRSVIYVDQTTLGISRSVLIDEGGTGNYDELHDTYKNYMIAAAGVVRDALGQSVADDVINATVENIFNFERELASITVPDEDRRNGTAMYNPMTVPELQNFTDAVSPGEISWHQLLSDVFLGSDVTPLPQDSELVVTEPEYFRNLTTLLANTDKRTLADYLGWRVVFELGVETNQEMRDLNFGFEQVFYGVSKPLPRWQVCVNDANSYLGMAVSYYYVLDYFPEEAKLEMERMVDYLREAFETLLNETTWMDADTRSKSLEKVQAIREFIAYPDWLTNTTALEAYYAGISVLDGQHFLNVGAMRNWWSVRSLNTLPLVPDKDEWAIWPSVVNAFYSSQANSITFPAGILQSPYFYYGRPNALNYGGIGVVIGHEITHGFDDQGRQYDMFGNLAQWWSPETIANYQVRAQCFIDQYSNYTVPEAEDILGAENAHLNGVTTQGENIADNGGVREAYLAYQYFTQDHGEEPRLPGLEQFTPEQLHFLGYGLIWCYEYTDEALASYILTNPHSPAKYRVWGPLTNTEDFSRVWGCDVGDNMNGEPDRCVLW